jgi:cytochrome P450
MSVNSNTALKQIYGYKANVQKSSIYTIFPTNPSAFSVHSAINKKVHARKRRTLTHGFSDNAIKDLIPHIQACTSTFNRHLYNILEPSQPAGRESPAPWSQSYDMAEWSNNLTFDVIAKMIFSKSFGMMENPKIRWIQSAIHAGARHRYIVGFQQFIYWYGLDRFLFADLTSARAKMRVFSVNQMQERITDPRASEKRDLIHILSNATDPETGESFTMQELGSETGLLITAGLMSFSNENTWWLMIMLNRLRHLLDRTGRSLLLLDA